ncbi:MAG: hypothetical protein ACI4UJ_09000 [Candidatus Cryptobacteroides sp.]
MKNSILIRTFAASLTVLAGLAFTGCSEDEKPIEKNLPVLEDISLAPGASEVVSFYAYGDWTATSNQDWCQLSAEAGVAGDNTVTVSAADAFADASTATVTLTIGQDSDVVTFNVTRTAKQREFTVSVDNMAVTELVFDLDANAEVTVTVNANFWWELDTESTTWPGWLVKPATKPNGQDGTGSFTLAINSDAIADYYEAKTGSISFYDVNDASATYTVDVRHTVEKPLPGANDVLTAECGKPMRLTRDGYFYDAAGNVTTNRVAKLTLNPEAGVDAYTAVIVGKKEAPGIDGSSSIHEGISNWCTLTKVDGTNDFNINIAAGTIPSAGSVGPTELVYTKVFAIVAPSSTFLGTTGPMLLFSIFGSPTATEVKPELATYTVTVDIDLP